LKALDINVISQIFACMGLYQPLARLSTKVH
jgi:hypothetical protein